VTSPKKARRKYFFKKKYLCKCGCGGRIKILKQYKYPSLGVPNFIQGHISKERAWKREARKRMLGNKYGLGNQNCLGRILSDKTKEKIRQKRIGKYCGKDNPFYGQHHSDATKQKIGKANSGENNHNYGKHLPLSTRKKMSERIVSPETREKLRQRGLVNKPCALCIERARLAHIGNKYNLGKKRSDITKEKLKKARLRIIIPHKDTSIEVKLQKALSTQKIKFRKHVPITGQPDIFIEPNICIFADGDYWHNLEKGKKRDKYVNRKLKQMGYVILRFWEHQINKDLTGCLNKIIEIC